MNVVFGSDDERVGVWFDLIQNVIVVVVGVGLCVIVVVQNRPDSVIMRDEM